MMSKRMWWLALVMFCSNALSAVDVITLSDFGKTDGWFGSTANYLIHFKLQDPDHSYPLDSVYIRFDDEDTFIQKDANGEYRYELWMKRDVDYIVEIGNAPYQDSKQYWKAGNAWSYLRTVFLPELPARPLQVKLTYPEPTASQLIEWTLLSGYSMELDLKNTYGLVEAESNDQDCFKLEESGYDFPFTYTVERCDSNFIIVTFGVFATRYSSETEWAKDITTRIKAELNHNYSGQGTVKGHEAARYRFSYQDISYLLYLVEDTTSHGEGYVGYKTTIYMVWD